MMHHNVMFDREAGSNYNTGSGYNSMQRKNRMRRMEELSHSLDDGLNTLPDDYNNGNRYNNNGNNNSNSKNRQRQQVQSRQQEPQYNDDMDDPDDFFDDDYIDDYYYNKPAPNESRPRSYNEKYSSYMYDDYDPNANFSRNRYSLNETSMSNKNDTRYQSSPMSQQKYSSLRKPQQQQTSTAMGGKHILFNDEDDIHYMNDNNAKSNPKKISSSTAAATATSSSSSLMTTGNTAGNKKDMRKEKESTVKKKADEMKMSKDKSSSLQVMKAKLKIHNLANDDSVLSMRNIPKLTNTFHRHHSVEAKLPAHHTDRNNLSPTILEEIEFETQDVETETEKESEYDTAKAVNEFDSKNEKDIDGKSTLKKKIGKPEKQPKDNKKGNSVPSTPTTKKSLKAHLTNKRLFKVPDIDLNNLKLSCFFSSSKNIAALKSKKDVENTSKSAEQLNEVSYESTPPPQSKTPISSMKTPPSSPKIKKPPPQMSLDNIEEQIVNQKYPAKCEKVIEKMNEEKIIRSNSQGKIDRDREMRNKTVHARDEDSFSDIESEVIYT